MDNNYLDYILTLNGMKGKTYRQSLVDDMVEDYNEANENQISRFRLLINTNDAKEVLINNKKHKGIIEYKRIKEPFLNAMVRILSTELGIQTYGDYVLHNDETYLVTAKIEPHFDYETSYIRFCNQTLKFKDINGAIHEIPTIVDKSYPSELDNPSNIVTLDTSKIYCSIGYSLRNSINLIKDYGQNPTRFIVGDRVWETESVDKTSKMIGKEQGLYVLVLKKITGCSDDDFENEIAKNVWDKDDVPENPDKEEKKELKIVGNDFIYQNLYADYSIENNADSLQFEWAVNDIELANIEKIENGTCRVRGNKKNKGYFILIAKNGDIELQKKIRVKGILDG